MKYCTRSIILEQDDNLTRICIRNIRTEETELLITFDEKVVEIAYRDNNGNWTEINRCNIQLED